MYPLLSTCTYIYLQLNFRSCFANVTELIHYSCMAVLWRTTDFCSERVSVAALNCTKSFRVYSSGTSGPVCFLLHGGGFSALSWAVLSVITCIIMFPLYFVVWLKKITTTTTTNQLCLALSITVVDMCYRHGGFCLALAEDVGAPCWLPLRGSGPSGPRWHVHNERWRNVCRRSCQVG